MEKNDVYLLCLKMIFLKDKHTRSMINNFELRKYIRVLAFLFVLTISCQCAYGQYIYNRSNITIGKIDSNGYVYDRSNMTVGRFKSDGYIVDRNNMTVGRIMSDGRIVDCSNMTIGKVDSDGYVKDRNNMTLGRVKSDDYVVDKNNITIGRAKDIPAKYVAAILFFNILKLNE